MSTAAEIDEVLISSEDEDEEDQVLAPSSPFDRAPVCSQCIDRDWVWALVVRCCQEFKAELEDFDYAAARGAGRGDDESQLVRMMERAELHGVPTRTYRRAVYIDICRMRTSLVNLKQAYAANSWEHREADRLRDCINAMYATMETQTTREVVRALYATTLRYELNAVHTSFMRLNARTGSQSQHDSELIFRTRLAAILMSESSALEPIHLRDFLRAEVPIIRTAANTLEQRLARETACQHNF